MQRGSPFLKKCAWLVPATVLVSAIRAQAGQWIAKDEYPAVTVVVADAASDTEKLAAHEFADLWKKATGHGVYVSNKLVVRTGVAVWIGREGVPDRVLGRLSLDDLGPDGFCLHTQRGKKGNLAHLLIIGGKERGTMYGVYQFFEDYFGVRFLAPDLTHVPKTPPPSLPEIDVHYVPPIVRRQMTYETYGMQAAPEDQRAVFGRHMRWSPNPEFGLFVHTAFTILPPEKYFAEHPDYYAEVNGKRVAPVGIDLTVPENMAEHGDLRSQLCFSNPKVAEAIAAELRPMMQANPGKPIWSVSQMDWDAYCRCERCRAIDAREGTPMGSVLTCVNHVADLIKDEFPHNYIETLAYTWSRKPPKSLRPRDNVIISLCAIECDYARPIIDEKAECNRPFVEDLLGWSAIAKTIYLWDYPANGYFAQIPFPNFDVLDTNYKFYADHHVRGMFLCGGALPADDLGALRCYLLSRLLWQPDRDIKPLMEEFLDLYYREAAPFIREYISLLTTTLRAKGAVLTCFDRGKWIDAETVTRADNIFQQALAAAQSDAVKQRIEDAYCSVRYCAIVCPPRIEITQGKFVLDRPPSMSVEDYIKHVTARGFKSFEGGRGLPEYIFDRTGKTAPPRHEESPIEKIENEHYLIWVVPAIKGSVIRWQDKRAGAELLRGYEVYGAAPGTWQDWNSNPPRTEGPAADVYEAAKRAPGSLTLRAAREDGLVIERKMVLKAGSDKLDVTLTLSNPTDKPLTPNLKLHPEFYAQGTAAPEIWVSKGGQWSQEGGDSDVRSVVRGKLLPPETCSRLAFHVPLKRLTVLCEFDPKDVGGAFWFVNTAPDAQQANLEILAKTDPLNPGEKRVVHATYLATRNRPQDMP